MAHRRRRVRRGSEFSFRPQRVHFNKRKFFRGLFNWFVIILAAAIVGYAFVTFLYQTVTMVGPSMRDTLADEDVVVVNKYVYKFHDVERYDIVAFSQVESDSYYEIKRIIGLPEEKVQIKDGAVYVNGTKLNDIPITDKVLSAGIAGEEITLGSDEYFVLGDNVNNSEDSRYTNIGNITSSEIVGRVDYIISPKSSRGKVK
ncbi:MAG: signal peptidase I [Wujia sp.]